MVKLIENSSRDIQIALANQIASMCEQAKVNPFEVINFANKHPRVSILQPGCGVGGHCIAVDPWFLIETFPTTTKLLQVARNVNDNKPTIVINKVLEQAKRFKAVKNRKPRVLALGLTFKPDIDDLRESPALAIAQKLNTMKELDLSVHDPYIEEELLQDMKVEQEMHAGLKKADIILILVKHLPFKTIKYKEIANKIIIDPCGLYSSKTGFDYETTFFRKRNSKDGSCSKTSR